MSAGFKNLKTHPKIKKTANTIPEKTSGPRQN
jgi:hypothetical protein